MEVGKTIKDLVVVADGKTYDHLISLKFEMGEALSWHLPYPGDWHILKNFQGTIISSYLKILV